ncbi:hypothetical protein [Alloactinosynnema sp. L-07]|nr:hypothetical protein [Alloactinosynnema sp. L-07]
MSTLTEPPAPSLADDLFAMDRPRDPQRWPVRDRIFWILVAAAALVLLIAFLPALAGALSAALVPRLRVPDPPTRHAQPVSYTVGAVAVDVVAVLMAPVWFMSDLFESPRKVINRCRDWWGADPARAWLLFEVALVALVFVAVLIGGI